MKTPNTPENPAINRALAVLRAGLGIAPTEPPKQPTAPALAAPVAPAKAKGKPAQAKPAKARKPTASKAPPPARDIWFYLTKGKA